MSDAVFGLTLPKEAELLPNGKNVLKIIIYSII